MRMSFQRIDSKSGLVILFELTQFQNLSHPFANFYLNSRKLVIKEDVGWEICLLYFTVLQKVKIATALEIDSQCITKLVSIFFFIALFYEHSPRKEK
jgi:hypothetical protein